MTTYDGRGYKYDSKGKEVVNREPPVSKHIVEKLYRIHRTNVINVEPLTDCHVIIPEFLTNTSWKKLGEKKKKRDVLVQNEKIYQRIAKVENGESGITKDIKEHVKRVEDVRSKMLKLSEAGRLKQLLKIQKDNTIILERIEKARPSITSEGIKEWYKPHVLYKDGRRSDVTAGHIMHNMGSLLPSRLPSLDSSVLSSNRSINSADYLTRGNSSSSVYSSVGMGSMGSLQQLTSVDDGYGYLSGLRSSVPVKSMSANDLSSFNMTGSHQSLPPMESDRTSARSTARTTGKGGGKLSAKGGAAPAEEMRSPVHRQGSGGSSSDMTKDTGKPPLKPAPPAAMTRSLSEGVVPPHLINPIEESTVGESSQDYGDSTVASAESDDEEEPDEQNAFDHGEEFVVLISRPFALPYESKNCQVSICCRAVPDELLYIRVNMFGDPPVFLGERIVHMNKALEIVNSTNNLAQQAANNEDLQALRAVLINMFKEADDDGNGFLTFDEFQDLLEKVDLGISSQEMRFVISEADENENGVVDYDEFVPLAVDMIQSFRSRNRAKTQTSQEETEIDEVIMQSMSQSEIDSITEMCMKRLKEIDVKGYGVLRPNDVKRCLNSVGNVFMNEKEVTMICQSLPRDPFNRCIYGGLKEVVSKIRFMTLKNNYVEARGSELHKYLLDRCREEEALIRAKRDSAGEVETGRLPFRTMTNLLQSSPRLSLSRLQVMVIMAEASAVEGYVDYYQFCPVVAKTIEIMFEPKTLRQRAELIEKTDLSPEALLSGLTSDEFRQKMVTLFKSYDIDHSGALDKDEFKSCLQALDFHLTDGEIAALKVTADLRTSGVMSFDDFINFFTQNLLQLEREKHIQILQKSLHGKTSKVARSTKIKPSGGSDSKAAADVVSSEQFSTHLETIFKLADGEGSGFLERDELEKLLASLDIHISQFQMECIMSELDVNDDKRIEYQKFIPICADLLAAFKAKEKAQVERESNEEWAHSKAMRIMKSSMHDINHIVRYIKERVCLIEETIEDPLTRMSTIHEVIRNPHSGLSRTEANSVIMKLFTLDAITGRSRHSFRKQVTKPTGRNTTVVPVAKGRKGAVAADHPSLVNATEEVSRHENTGEVVLTTHDLRQAVIEARENSIMRSLLEDIDPESLETNLLDHCTQLCDKLVAEGQIAPNTDFLPISALFQVLEQIPNLRLNKAQLMAILSWVPPEAYDLTGSNVDFRQFSLFAAGVISKMRKPDNLDNRAAILDNADLSEEALLKGLSEKDLHDYFVEKFSLHHANEDKISQDNFCAIIVGIPHLKLSKSDALTILGSFPRSQDGCITWREFLPWSHNTILHLLREKSIQQIMANQQEEERKKLEAEEKRSEFKSLADKLIEYVKIKQQNDIVHVYLPGDNTARRSILLQSRLLSPTSGRPVPNAASGMDEEEVYDTSDRSTQVLRVIRRLPTKYCEADLIVPTTPTKSREGGSRLRGMGQKSASSLMGAVAQASAIEVKKKAVPPPPPFPVFISVVAVNNTANLLSVDKDLIARVINSDGSFNELVPLPLKLPSLGLYDKETAELFTLNLIDKMIIELPHPNGNNRTRKPKVLIDIV